jgi:NAD(P)-dependent dehydrogenase (short-subunit alcohol dehydrogenase family)
MSLKGKTLFITGASRGIGLAIALRAARDGANIAIAAKTETRIPSSRARSIRRRRPLAVLLVLLVLLAMD